MENSSKSKQGFFFTILALVVVSFIFVSVQLWAQTVQVEEARAAERFRVEALRTSLELIDNESLNRFSKASMAYAMEKLASELNNHEDKSVYGIESNTVRYPDGTGNVNKSVYDLMVNGSTSAYLARSNPLSCPNNAKAFYANCSNLTYNLTEENIPLGIISTRHPRQQKSLATILSGASLTISHSTRQAPGTSPSSTWCQ